MGYLKTDKIPVKFLHKEKEMIYIIDIRNKKLLIRDNKIAIFANFNYYEDKEDILYLDSFIEKKKIIS